MSAERPSVLFSCVHNSGRSVAAAALLRHYADGRVEVRSAGSDPGSQVNPVVAEVLAERGLPVMDHTPTRLRYDLVEAADVVVTMSCGETCPYVPGKRYEDWPVEDPKGQGLDAVRLIVDDLDARVHALLAELVPPGRQDRRSGSAGDGREAEARRAVEDEAAEDGRRAPGDQRRYQN